MPLTDLEFSNKFSQAAVGNPENSSATGFKSSKELAVWPSSLLGKGKRHRGYR